MSDQNSPSTTAENVGRGVAFAALSIAAAIIIFAIAGGIFQFWGVAAFVVPPIAAALYARGAGAPLSRRGWAPFVGVNVVAIILGIVGGVIGGAWAGFTTVGGNGGPFGAPFLHLVGNQFSDPDTLLPVVIALALGAVSIVSVIRGPRNRPAQVVAPGTLPSSAPPAPPAPPVAPASPVPPASQQPSPGVMLNGKPVDPNAK